MIDPVGDIYQCISGIGHPEFKVGSIYDNLADIEREQARFIESDIAAHCHHCEFFIKCQGGCDFKRIILKDKSYCRKKSLRAVYKEEVAAKSSLALSSLNLISNKNQRDAIINKILMA